MLLKVNNQKYQNVLQLAELSKNMSRVKGHRGFKSGEFFWMWTSKCFKCKNLKIFWKLLFICMDMDNCMKKVEAVWTLSIIVEWKRGQFFANAFYGWHFW